MGFMSWNKPYGCTGKPVDKHAYTLTKMKNETREIKET